MRLLNVLLLLALLTRHVDAVQLLTDPGPRLPAVYLTPNTTQPPIFHGQLNGPVGRSNPSWHITQWNTWQDLPAQGLNGSGTPTPCVAPPRWPDALELVNFTTAASGHLCLWRDLHSKNIVVELLQNGDHLPCGNEFDSFLEPTSPAVYPNFPAGIIASQPLASITSMNVSFTACMYDVPTVEQRCGTTPQCQGSGQVDYGYAVLGVVLGNAQDSQTLFYQLILGDTRDNTGCPHHPNSCDENSMSWYANSNPFGASDYPGTLDVPCLGMSSGSHGIVNQSVTYQLDLLPRFKYALLNGPEAISHDLSKWSVTGIYLGLGMEGQVTQHVALSGLSVVAQ
eukprot:m.149471 g.149471  ORF g.149471 m.149471 type:complete len:339 (-) comp16157_c0_seq19:1275-2291(-)